MYARRLGNIGKGDHMEIQQIENKSLQHFADDLS